MTAEDRLTIPKPPGGGRKLSPEDFARYWLHKIRQRVQVSETGCWVWPGATNTKGYGQTYYQGVRACFIHRKVYEITHGVTLRREQFVCHSCDVKRCCNPEHLWVGTNGQNQRDAALKGFHQETKKTHCPRGHEYNEQNTYRHPGKYGNGARNCKVCQRDRQRQRYLANREAYNARNRMYRQRRKERERQSV